MTAKEILSPGKRIAASRPFINVDAGMPLLEVLPRVLDAPHREVGVCDGDIPLGVIDQTSLLEGLGRMIAARDDCSVITVDCSPGDYSASLIAHAVEDSDAHLVDLFTSPDREDRIRVTLRVRNTDPTATVRSLERYGYTVVSSYGSGIAGVETAVATERLMSLQALLNV